MQKNGENFGSEDIKKLNNLEKILIPTTMLLNGKNFGQSA